ncbi:MAG: putative sulfate exporter family transporter [Fibrobacteria bacterium]|nr:putative sulfate exporter family transporter [Fibrobacteria bacterium]
MVEEVKQTDEQLVQDTGRSQFSDLWKKEDYWAIWLGGILLLIGLIVFLPQGTSDINKQILEANTVLETEAAKAPFKTVAWYQAVDTKAKLKASNSSIGKKLKVLTSQPGKWTVNPFEALILGEDRSAVKNAKATKKFNDINHECQIALQLALQAQTAAGAVDFQNMSLNKSAEDAIDNWRRTSANASKAKKNTKIKAYNLLPSLFLLMGILALFFGVGLKVMGGAFWKFIPGFCFVFAIAVVAYMASNNQTMKQYGIGYAAWAILFGLIISNTIGTPKWVMSAVQTEYYIKTGLVLLGAEILFGKILSIGIPGIFVAWIVTPIVLLTTFWFGQKVLKIPSKTLNMTISADMSVCGVSAAIATAAACRAKKEELTLAVGLSLVFTSIMMIVMPAVIKATGMPFILGGAWMGGTIDATGAVAAAGAFLSEKALYVAATIKMIQNVLIGIIAFFVALYWVAKVDREKGKKLSYMEIWHRFPKFVLGFITASILFSLLYEYLGKDMAYVVIDHGVIRGLTKNFRGWFFCLAFVSIGLATDFRQLKGYFKGGKPLILYICGQSLNLALTLLMAYIMFYLVFTDITDKI